MKWFTDSNEIGPNVHHLLNKLCELVGPAAASLTARQLSPHSLVRPGPTGTELFRDWSAAAFSHTPHLNCELEFLKSLRSRSHLFLFICSSFSVSCIDLIKGSVRCNGFCLNQHGKRVCHNPEMWHYTRYPKSFHQHFFNLTAETAASFEISKLLLLSAVTRPSEVDAAANSLSIKCNMQSRSVTVIRVAAVIFTRSRPEERDRRIFRRYAPVNAVR